MLAEWPDSDFIDLLALLKKRGSRLRGNIGQYVLRFMGEPAYIFSKDVVMALIRESVIDKPATSKRAFAEAQEAFNQWSRETGRDLSQISRLLAAIV